MLCTMCCLPRANVQGFLRSALRAMFDCARANVAFTQRTWRMRAPACRRVRLLHLCRSGAQFSRARDMLRILLKNNSFSDFNLDRAWAWARISARISRVESTARVVHAAERIWRTYSICARRSDGGRGQRRRGGPFFATRIRHPLER